MKRDQRVRNAEESEYEEDDGACCFHLRYFLSWLLITGVMLRERSLPFSSGTDFLFAGSPFHLVFRLP
jgi:hypothetical protein